MAVEATHVVQFAVATVYVALACWLLFLDFSRTINRILALLLFMRGAAITLNQFVTLDPAHSNYWQGTRFYFFIATGFVIIDFLIVYTWRTTSPTRRGARQFLLAVAVAMELVYLLDHGLVATRVDGVVRFGPLAFIAQLYLPLLAIASLWFAWLARHTNSPAQARFHALVALAFSTAAIAETAGLAGTVLLSGWKAAITAAGPSAGAMIAQMLALSAIPMGLGAALILAGRAIEQEQGRSAAWVVGIPLFTLALPILVRVVGGGESHSYLLFNAMPRAFAALLLTYALARQIISGPHAFQLDLRAGAGVRRGTVGGVLVAIFFVVSESAAQLFSQFAATQNLSPVISQLIGIVGAGILLVFLHPLNRLGERLSTSVLPNAKPLAELADHERSTIYQEQVELAWADGSITRKERLLLDKLREQLRLPISQAVTLESRAARQASG